MKLARFKFHSGQTQHPRGRQKYEIRPRSAYTQYAYAVWCGVRYAQNKIFLLIWLQAKTKYQRKMAKNTKHILPKPKRKPNSSSALLPARYFIQRVQRKQGELEKLGKQWEQRNQCVTDIYGTFQNSQLFCTTSIVGKWPSNRKKQVVETYEQPAYMAVKYPVEFWKLGCLMLNFYHNIK